MFRIIWNYFILIELIHIIIGFFILLFWVIVTKCKNMGVFGAFGRIYCDRLLKVGWV